MPALPAVPKVIRIDLFFTIGINTRVRDRFFLQYTGTLSTADLTTILGTINTQWGTNIKSFMSNSSTLTSIQGTDLTSSSSPQVVVSVSQVGTDTFTQFSLGTAAVIKFKINRRYRGGHPRFYLAGICADRGGQEAAWAGAFLTALSAAWSAFITGVTTTPPVAVGTLTQVNVSYFSGFTNKTFASGRTRPVPTLRGTPVVDTVIGASVNPNPASQRRRNLQSA